jgi:hypothetical protein
MDLSNTSAITSLVEMTSGIGGLWYLGLKIVREVRKAKKAEANRIIEECKELDLVVKSKLEAKINMLESQMQNLKSSVEKDLTSLKDNHAIELKNLSERVEQLRSDLATHNSQIIALLMKMAN